MNAKIYIQFKQYISKDKTMAKAHSRLWSRHWIGTTCLIFEYSILTSHCSSHEAKKTKTKKTYFYKSTLLQLKPGISTQALFKVLKIKASICKEYHCMLMLNISQSIYTHIDIKYFNQIFKSSSMEPVLCDGKLYKIWILHKI